MLASDYALCAEAVAQQAMLMQARSPALMLIQAVRAPCGSGFTREESNAVHGTGYAGVRG